MAARDSAVHLFLDQSTGERISNQSLYDTWRGVDKPEGWSPHLGRDYWACSLLWSRMQQQKQLLELALKRNIEESTLQALQMNALSVIQLEIQPQLRHISSETTVIYLQWLADQLGININAAYEISDENELYESES
jgi:hypothetical protein